MRALLICLMLFAGAAFAQGNLATFRSPRLATRVSNGLGSRDRRRLIPPNLMIC
jgi:hypothetical protein